MAEEVGDAAIVVPKAMIWSFAINIPFTFGMVISYLYCLKSIPDALSDPTGFPFIYVFRQATGSAGGTTGLTVVILILITMITTSAMASTSRQTFAFARDRGLPLGGWIGAVNERLRAPANAVIFTVIVTCLVSLINIGSTVAFNALLSLATVALMGTYVISIGCVTLRRFNKDTTLPPARWSLGKAGLPVNVIALLYAFYGFFWSFWPNAYDVIAANFNYACVIFVGVMGFGTVLYFAYARKVYDGPVSTVEGRVKHG